MGFGAGKIIVVGEHAVVYGYPALAAALDHGVDLTPSTGDGKVTIPQWGLTVAIGDDHPVANAIRSVATAMQISSEQLATIRLVGDAQLPAGAGLGSSAALMVATARALNEYFSLALTDEKIAKAANEGEKVFHDKPSGVDVALATYCTVGRFVRAQVGAQPEFVKLDLPKLTLVVGNTGENRSTKTMVQTVATATKGDRNDHRLAELGSLTDETIAAWQRRNWAGIGQCLARAQVQLAALGVSSPRIDELCAAAVSAGALGAKLTGAGGGGCVIAAVENPQTILDAWTKLGAKPWTTTLGNKDCDER